MLQRILQDLLHYTQNMQPKQWLLLLLVTLVLGMFCLRGMGSRKNQ
jgi:hypothetical protein